jgi:NAD(P)-dependent dehydrogenase (short-subunit alcohol dehydrogenase family)
MDLGLRGKSVVVTGGSKGIGLACARMFVSEGARVGISSRSSANIERACAELGGVFGFAADLTSADKAAAMVEAMESRLGPTDILVNCAGAARRTPPDELTPAAWKAAMDAKFFTYIHVIGPVVKRMAARGAGVIANVIGNGGKVAALIHLAGGAANAALMLATAGLALCQAGRESGRAQPRSDQDGAGRGGAAGRCSAAWHVRAGGFTAEPQSHSAGPDGQA